MKLLLVVPEQFEEERYWERVALGVAVVIRGRERRVRVSETCDGG